LNFSETLKESGFGVDLNFAELRVIFNLSRQFFEESQMADDKLLGLANFINDLEKLHQWLVL
jgi:hypothetical protein